MIVTIIIHVTALFISLIIDVIFLNFREILTLEDGGQVALDWDHPTKADENTPIILILPGLTGDSQASYVKKFVISGVDEGFRMVVFNYRGLGGIPLKVCHLLYVVVPYSLIDIICIVKKWSFNSSNEEIIFWIIFSIKNICLQRKINIFSIRFSVILYIV